MNPTTQPTPPPPPSLQSQPQLQPQPQPQPPPLLPPPPQAPPLQQPQQQLLQPHRPSTSCDRHPQENFTGFCPLCLCERLAVLDPNNSNASSSSSRKPPTSSTAAAALKAIFRANSSAATGRSNRPPTSSFLPELRRTKSFSASKNEGFSGVFEPQRKSCDVRVRSTLYSLFNQDDERKISKNEGSRFGEVEVETRNLASSSIVQGPVIESKEEEEEEEEEENQEEDVVVEEEVEEEEEEDDEIRVLEEAANVVVSGNVIENRVQEIVEEEPEPEPAVLVAEEELLKPMKEHIDLDSQTKKSSGRDFKEIAGSFWSAASVFSKKLQKWRQKQKMKKQRRNGVVVGSATLPVEKPIGRQFRETQSEIADYGFGRRSCDTDPRFSLDAGRMSFDAGRISFEDSRYSFDEPRASWDGYLIGRSFPRMPTMLSVVEDAPVQVMRTDTQIPVEEPMMNAINENEDETLPGGSAQTREYYSDSSSRRRKSLDRSSSIRKTAAAVVAEMDELKPVSSGIGTANNNANANANTNTNANANAKVTPASVDYFHGQKVVFPDRDLRDSNSNSLRDDCSETFEVGFRDTGSVIGNGGDRKGSTKKWPRWSKAWNIWGLINRRGGGNKDEDEDNRYSSRGNGNGVERSLSESWQEFRGERNGDARGGGFNPKVLRSNSSVSWRNAQSIGGSFGTVRKSDVQANGHGRKGRDEFVLERNRSARYSPNNIDNGLLRLYLTPMQAMRGSRRNGSGKGRSNQAHSIARSVLRLY